MSDDQGRSDYDEEVYAAIKAHKQALDGIWHTAQRIRLDSSLDKVEQARLLTNIYSPLSTKDIKHTIVDDLEKYNIGLSFRSSISKIRHVKNKLKKYGYNIAPGGNAKLIDRNFAQNLGVPTPKTIFSGKTAQELELIPNTVIKPVSGSAARGVFFVDSELNLQSLESGQVYATFESAIQELKSGAALTDAVWLAEEVILGRDGRPAHDVKVYMFYGEAGLIIEIERPSIDAAQARYASYGPDGAPLRFRAKPGDLEGVGLPGDVLEKASRISLASPVPFLRVDFHAGADECYLGEITAHPGGTHAGAILDDLDKSMGQRFVDAEARLLIDLLSGKRFNKYFEVYEGSSPDS